MLFNAKIIIFTKPPLGVWGKANYGASANRKPMR